MCHYLNALGQFQSDQYLCLAPDEIVLSFRDPAAIEALQAFADLTEDDDLPGAIVQRLDAIADECVKSYKAAEQINKQIGRQTDKQSAEALVYGKR